MDSPRTSWSHDVQEQLIGTCYDIHVYNVVLHDILLYSLTISISKMLSFVLVVLAASLSSSQEFTFTASCGGANTGLETNTNGSNCKAIGDKIDKLVSIMPAAYRELANEKKAGYTPENATVLAKLDAILSHPPPSYIPSSCEDVKDNWPNSVSGYYNIASMNGSTRSVYCHMGSLCNTSTTGAWTRIAYLNMSDPTQNCPTSSFGVYSSNHYRGCGFSSYSHTGCRYRLHFSPPSSGYQEVCGRVIGYQYGYSVGFSSSSSIDSTYVDGLSLTYGAAQRKHIWTFGVGLFDNVASSNNCPCSSGRPQSVPPFVGNDYFCESGNSEASSSTKLFYSDALWDGAGCGSLEGRCCIGAPWFYRDLGTQISDSIEMRLCSQTSSGSPVVVSYEIYVK